MSAQKPNFLDVLEERHRAELAAAASVVRDHLRGSGFSLSSASRKQEPAVKELQRVSEIRLSGEGPLLRIWNDWVDARGKR